MEQKDWIEQVMQGMDNVQQVQPDASLFEQIEGRINQHKAKLISLPTIIGVAASLLLLVALNINTITTIDASSNETNELLETLEMETSNQLYN